jgi:xanthine dehydrogenase iron-sulfur cluster and FAD-binding subunit A
MKWFLTIAAAVALAAAFAALAARTSRLGERVDRLEEEQQPKLRLLALRF